MLTQTGMLPPHGFSNTQYPLPPIPNKPSGGIKHHVYLLTSATLVSSAYPDTIAVTSVLTCIFWQLSCWKHQSLPSPQCQPPPPPSALSKLFHKNAKKETSFFVFFNAAVTLKVKGVILSAHQTCANFEPKWTKVSWPREIKPFQNHRANTDLEIRSGPMVGWKQVISGENVLLRQEWSVNPLTICWKSQ